MKSIYNKYSVFLVLFLISISNGYLFGQSESNFNIITNLLDSSINQILQQSNLSERINLEFNASKEYSVFKNILVLSLQQRNKKVDLSEDNNSDKLSYSLQNVKVNYNDVHKNGIFGGYTVNRSVMIKGNYFTSIKGEVKQSDKIELVKTDTVDYDEIKKLENPAYPFTQTEIPSIPFFSTILEPIIALGTVAVTIFLFFTVRSN